MRREILAGAMVLLGVAVLASAGEPAPTPVDKALASLQVFPKNDDWNRDISAEPVDPNSAALIASAGSGKPLHPDWGTKYGIPFQLVSKETQSVTPKFQYADESDQGPYPIPLQPLIEGVLAGGPNAPGDRHILCIDPERHMLYELWNSWHKNGQWQCGSGAVFDLRKISSTQRPKGWTSADAAGLPIFPGLARYDEVCIKKEIPHALRFTLVKTRRGFVPPATHFASRSKDDSLPPMGMRVRLKADVDISKFPPEAQVVLKCLKQYGMILADNGSDWFITGAPDPRWNDEALNSLKKIKARDLEVIKMPPVTAG